jgi:hypothetical protein
MGAESYSYNNISLYQFVSGGLPEWLHWKQKRPMKPKTRALQRFRDLRSNQNQWLTCAEIERKVIESGVNFPMRLRLWTGPAY